MKKCCRCKVEKPLTEFGKNRANSDGLQRECDECRKEVRAASYRRKNPNAGEFVERPSRKKENVKAETLRKKAIMSKEGNSLWFSPLDRTGVSASELYDQMMKDLNNILGT